LRIQFDKLRRAGRERDGGRAESDAAQFAGHNACLGRVCSASPNEKDKPLMATMYSDQKAYQTCIL
jgi:hypothetical protein